MRKILIIFLLGFGTMGFLTQCEDMIDEQPVDLLPTEVSLSKLATYQGLINSAFDRTQAFAYLGQYAMLAPDALADNAILVNNTGRYVGELVNRPYSSFNYWALYPAVNDCNIVLDRIDTLVRITNTTATRTNARILAVQALFLRAMIYFDMVRVYGYEPEEIVGGWDKGIILRDKPVFDVSQADLRPRATVEETYEFIEADLLAAIDSMTLPAPNNVTTIPNQPFRPSLAAIHGLLAKVYLHWGKDALAITQTDRVLATKAATIQLATAANYATMWSSTAQQTSGRTESLFELRIQVGTGANQDWSSVDGLNESLHSMTTFGITTGTQFVLAGSDDLMAAFELGDIRKDMFTQALVRGRNYNMTNKWPGAAGTGLFADNIPVLRLSEIYLIRAEAYFNQNNEPDALIALNEIRTRRGLTALTAATTGQALFNKILNESRVEFAFEGRRWFDLKRNGLTVPKNDVDDILYTDYRILAPIPLAQITLNPVLEQNPGY